MKRYLYGKKMFIIDLILVSIWAFFFSRYSSSGLMLLILVRIALNFEMYRKSPWALVSAIGFLIAYTCVDNFSRPFERMFYNFFCAVGQSKLMVAIFSEPFEWEMKAWIGSISALWFIWLAVLPIVVGIRLHNIGEIQWKRKWIWIYLIPVTGLCSWVMFDEGSVGGILLGLVISLLPVLYWCMYERKGRSLIQTLINQKEIRWSLAYAVFMLFAVTIGLKDISSLKLVGVLTLPALFYIMLTRSMNAGIVLTRICVALSAAGLCYWLTLHNGETETVILFIIAFGLIAYSGVAIVCKTHKWLYPLLLVTSIPIMIIPAILGLNPYVVTDADYTRMYVTNLSVRNGVYVVEKYVEIAEPDKPHFCGRKYGLRDRYGIILPIVYDELKPVDRCGRYIATNSPDKYGCMKADQRYGVYDLRKRVFVVNPDNLEVAELEKIDDKSFKLINPEGRYFATLYLPGEYRGVYFADAHIEPHFAEGETSVAEFIERAQNPELDRDNPYWKSMRKENPHAYKILVQMISLSGEESSPMNDLNYARAIREIINNDTYYRGNVEKALDDVANLSETITDSGSQTDINTWTDYLRLIASIRASLAYDSILKDAGDNEWVNNEYVAWHNLMEVMAYYLDELYSTETYRAVPEEKNNKITAWLDYRRSCIDTENKILDNKLIYSVSPAKADSIKGKSEYQELFSKFHSYSDPYYYNPMWNEIKTAFDEWQFSRAKLAEQLELHIALSYREYSSEVVDSIFSFIKGLDHPCFRPAL